jgi:biopolymer transport protein ExbB/TolQ
MIQMIAQQFSSGGPFMWVILAVLGFALAVGLERCIYYFIYCNQNSYRTIENVIRELKNKNIDRARKLVTKRKTPFNVLLKTAFDKHTNGAPINRVMEDVERLSITELPRISNRINYLSLLANVATLLGLLGTITGLQASFESLSTVDAASKATMLASGISQAMNTTAFGLIVAVPCMIMYTVLSNKQQSLFRDIDSGIAMFIDAIKGE